MKAAQGTAVENCGGGGEEHHAAVFYWLLAKKAGVYKGRTPSIDPTEVRRLAAEGLGGSEIAKRLGIGRTSVYRLLDAQAAA